MATKAFHTKGFAGHARGAENCADFGKSAADGYAVLQHS
jgi:hypothetical protein